MSSDHQTSTTHPDSAQMIQARCPRCGKAYGLPARRIGRRAKCGCGAEFTITPDTPAAPPSGHGIEIVEPAPQHAGPEQWLGDFKLLGVYTAERPKGIPGGRVSVTTHLITLHKFDQLRFWMVGPFLALLPPVHRWITRKPLYEFPLTSLTGITDSSPRSHARVRLDLADGASFELRLSKLGKGKVAERFAAKLDRLLAEAGGMRLQRLSQSQWQVVGANPRKLPTAIVEPAIAPHAEPDLPVAVAEVVQE